MNKMPFPIEIVDVVNAEPQEAYRIKVRFSDGREGLADLSDIVGQGGPMVELLRDHAFFARVFIEDGALTWPNGFDLDSIALHHKMAEAGLLTRSAA